MNVTSQPSTEAEILDRIVALSVKVKQATADCKAIMANREGAK